MSKQLSKPSKFDTSQPMFTYAAESSNDDAPTLLFHTNAQTWSQSQELGMAERIANSPVYREIMGSLGTTIYRNSEDVIVASPWVHDDVFRKLEQAREDDKVTVIPANNSGPPEVIDLHDTFYSCVKPHKLIVGCVECFSEGEGVNDCHLKKILLDRMADARGGTDFTAVEDLKDRLKSRESEIAEFIFVSPRLTAISEFQRTCRTINQHSFTEVESRSWSASKASIEKARITRFAKTECSKCLVNDKCASGWYRRRAQKMCEGPYDLTEEELTRKILSSVVYPYTREELNYCVNACGELNKRVDRMKYYAAFSVEGPILTFGLRRKRTAGRFIPLVNFKDAKEAITKYAAPIRHTEIEIGDSLLATLIELTRRGRSPRYSSGFCGATYWPILTIEVDPICRGLDVTFARPGRRGGIWRPHRFQGLTSPLDVYAEYGEFVSVARTESPLGWSAARKARGWRY